MKKIFIVKKLNPMGNPTVLCKDYTFQSERKVLADEAEAVVYRTRRTAEKRAEKEGNSAYAVEVKC